MLIKATLTLKKRYMLIHGDVSKNARYRVLEEFSLPVHRLDSPLRRQLSPSRTADPKRSLTASKKHENLNFNAAEFQLMHVILCLLIWFFACTVESDA
jgi:hypothetical protein